jgi:hypothetical protein
MCTLSPPDGVFGQDLEPALASPTSPTAVRRVLVQKRAEPAQEISRFSGWFLS